MGVGLQECLSILEGDQMNRDKFLKYLSQSLSEMGLFLPAETTEPILVVYNIVKWAVQARCDTIKVASDQVTWLRREQEIGQLRTPISFKPSFQKVLERDSRVRSHLRILNDMEDIVEYELNL